MPFLDELGKLTPFSDQISSWLHPERGYDAALEALEKRYNESKGYVTPYANQGQEQYGRLNQGIESLLHPEDLMSRFISSYQESPYTKQLIEQNRQRGLEGASSMGLMGSSAALGNIQQGAGMIANQAREQYLKDMMDRYLQGLGLSSGIYNTGAGAAGKLMEGANKFGENEANLIYGRENAPGDWINNLLRTGGQIGGALFGGGGGYLH